MSRRQNARRVFGRCRVELTVGFWSLREKYTPIEYMKGRTIDLSEGGVLFQCDKLEEGFLDDISNDDARFALRIHLSGELDWVRAVAKVVWIDDSDGDILVRACFVEIDDDSQRKICGVVRQGVVEKTSLS